MPFTEEALRFGETAEHKEIYWTQKIARHESVFLILFWHPAPVLMKPVRESGTIRLPKRPFKRILDSDDWPNLLGHSSAGASRRFISQMTRWDLGQ